MNSKKQVFSRHISSVWIIKDEIKFSFIFLLNLFIFTSCGTIYDFPEEKLVQKNNWKIVWEENFNGSSIDTTYWSKTSRGGATWAKYMTSHDTCYEFRDETLVLKGLKNDFLQEDKALYLTGGLHTRGKKTIRYGRIEVRARINKVLGAWPAIWMLCNDRTHKGEIDIMETFGFDNAIHQTVHSYYTLFVEKSPVNFVALDVKDKSDYNTYGAIINEKEVILYINNSITFIYKKNDPEVEGQFPFGDDKYLLLTMQLDSHGENSNYITDTVPEMQIDWVRFYEKIDETIPDY